MGLPHVNDKVAMFQPAGCVFLDHVRLSGSIIHVGPEWLPCVCVCAWIVWKDLKLQGTNPFSTKEFFPAAGSSLSLTTWPNKDWSSRRTCCLSLSCFWWRCWNPGTGFPSFPVKLLLPTHRNHRLMTKHQECLNFQSKCVCCGGCLWGATGPGLRPEATPRPGSNWLHDPQMELYF